MFEWQRFSKEDYKSYASNPVWTFWNTVVMMASFETEIVGGFGETDEFFIVDREAVINNGLNNEYDRDLTPVEQVFDEKYGKWNKCIFDALAHGGVKHVDVPTSDYENYEEEGVVSVDSKMGSFSRDDFLSWLSKSAKGGKIDVDIDALFEFLNGRGSAPSRKEVEIKVVELSPSEHHRRNAIKRHEVDKPKHKELKEFLMADLSGGCTCTKRQACERIFRDKYRSSETYLKSETGYAYLSFTREVTGALKRIENQEKTGINRHENTSGFSMSKVPPCTKHPAK
ncbi:MAG: hypothetical protein C0617_11050 [Desulfuromonas sp.]|uniref:hypothetical protein n=1 Tax=Desulfuromonas sp. TaxID=892 RepID=UPI000CB020A5|nr:hypothetical protein [Desulfuromonas sp.]PLX83663.1 MAG: hypothetical protein C0617_11050 [Desulfuromonas sp.]